MSTRPTTRETPMPTTLTARLAGADFPVDYLSVGSSSTAAHLSAPPEPEYVAAALRLIEGYNQDPGALRSLTITSDGTERQTPEMQIGHVGIGEKRITIRFHAPYAWQQKP